MMRRSSLASAEKLVQDNNGGIVDRVAGVVSVIREALQTRAISGTVNG